MTRADTLKEIADHHYALADLFTQLAGDSASASESAARPVAASGTAAPASFDSADYQQPEGGYRDEPLAVPAAIGENPFTDQGGDAICPKHRKPYKDGKFGPYCTSTSDDPAWSNKRGYCSITPKNAATYLRVKAAA